MDSDSDNVGMTAVLLQQLAHPTREDTPLSELAMDLDHEHASPEARKGPTTFLDLPPGLRARTYRHAGLRRSCTIDLTGEADRTKRDENDSICSIREYVNGVWVPDGRDKSGVWRFIPSTRCDHPKLPFNIFLASQAIGEDASRYFFSHNRFSLRLTYASDLALFTKAVEAGGMHQMRYLHVDLRFKDNRYIRADYGTHNVKFNLWSKFCEVARNCLPNLRAFSVKTKVKELDLASKLICAMEPFPRLYDCAFNFDTTEQLDIVPVLKRTALRLTIPARHRSEQQQPFRFLDLPKEIQLMIHELLLTNRWDPFMYSSAPAKGIVTLLNRKTSGTQQPFPITCCGTCSIMKTGCFCRTHQTAFSTSCTCFSSPLPYFLVCREFYEDARAVFFSRNNFALMAEDPDLLLRVSSSIPTSSFMKIRHLTLRFPFTSRPAFRRALRVPEKTSLLSWSVVHRFIREHFQVNRLSLVVIDLGSKATELRDLRGRYMRKLLKSFAALRDLKEFRVYLGDHPLLEQEVEKAVMGPRYQEKRPVRFVPLFGTRIQGEQRF